MNQDKKVPKLRFPGFSGEWERHKFSDLVAIERGGSPRPIDKFITKDKTGLNWIKIGDAPKYGNYITQTAEKIRPEGLSKTREVHSGDLILSNSMSFGRPYIMAIDGCIHDGWLAIRDTKNNFDLNFLCTLLGTDCMLNQYKRMAAGSTVNNLNKELVGGTVVPLPNAKEQQKIGSFFANLDSIITHQQRKLESLKKLKKGLLQKMYPKKGQSVPELRFPGFTGVWEEKKLTDLAGKKVGGGTPSTKVSEYWNGDLPWIQSSDIEIDNVLKVTVNKKITKSGLDNSSAKLIMGNSIAIVTRVGVGKLVYMPFEYATSQDFISLSDIKTDHYFLTYLLYRQLKADVNIQGTSIKGITKDYLLSLDLLIPSSIQEQKKIGSFFANLDSTITQQQRKLDFLKKLKKGLLQQMFV